MPHAYHKIERLITGNEKENPFFSFEWFMYLLSFVYHFIAFSRSAVYKNRFLKTKKLPCPVISIGNITVGGTGKTPMTIYITKLLLGMGFKPGVLSRGYKGDLEHRGGIVSDGKKICCTPEEAGDEPYMLARMVSAPVIVGKNRYVSGLKAIKNFSCNVLILDDGFQHQQLQRDLDILLMDAKAPLGNGFMLPRGPLREPPGAAQRSHGVIFTRSGSKDNPQNETVKRKPCFRCSHEPFISKIQPRGKIPPKGDSVLLFTGIVDHSSVKKSCEKLGLAAIKHLKYPDHHSYSATDIKTIFDEFKNSGADMVATTHKDYIKVMDIFPSGYPLLVIDVKINFAGKDKPVFENWVKKQIGMAASNS